MSEFPHRPQLERTIAQAMKENAPYLYWELCHSGRLAAAISVRADIAEEAFEIGMSDRYRILQCNSDYINTVQALTTLRNRASEAAIDAAVEFGPS